MRTRFLLVSHLHPYWHWAPAYHIRCKEELSDRVLGVVEQQLGWVPVGWLLLLDVASRPRGSFHLKSKLLTEQAILGPALMASTLPLLAAALLLLMLLAVAVVEAWLATTARVRHLYLVLVGPRLLAKNLWIEPTLLVGAVAASSAVEPHSLENQAFLE